MSGSHQSNFEVRGFADSALLGRGANNHSKNFLVDCVAAVHSALANSL